MTQAINTITTGHNTMMLIQQTVYTEGNNLLARRLAADLRDWHQQHPVSNGVDWENQVFWAKMTEEDFLMFAIKHPEHAVKFKKVD